MHELARTELCRLLVGNCFTTIEIGDAWALAFDRFWLVAQEIFPPDEDDLARAVAQARAGDPPIVDSADLPRALGVLRCRRRPVSGVTVLDDASLSVAFEGGGVLNVPTDVDVVDWYWGLSKENVGPHTSFLVACFERGRIEVADRDV